MLEERGIEHAAESQAWLRATLEEIVSQVRRLLSVTGVSFLVLDAGRAHIRPAASWFASDSVRDAFGPVLARPYEPARAGVTEAAVETGRPVRIERIEDWTGAAGLRDRLFERLDAERAQRLWDWYRDSSFLSCPVRTREGRILGVLAIARSLPEPAFSAEDQRVTEALADLAAFALERAQLLDDEEALGRAARAVSATLDPAEVVAAVLDQVRALTGAREAGFLPSDHAGRVRGGTAPALAGAEVRVPVALGARLFGVLTASAPETGFAPGGLARLVALAPVAAAALANAHAYDRERRVARAMTAGFVPPRPPGLDDHEVGLVYEPAGRQASGGDVFGVWTMPGGALGLLVGDVSGSGLEVAATAAMVRFFVEARTFDCDRPAEVLRQTNAILRSRLPEGLFVPAFLAVVEGRRLRWCNGGHPPPQLLCARGGEPVPLGTTGLPLGIDAEAGYEERECTLAAGDVLLAATDGLWEARRDGVQFGDARLPGLLAEHGRALDPQALAVRLRDEAHAWSPQLDDDLVVLAMRVRPVTAQLRAEAPDGPASRALWAEYMALLGERLDAPPADPEHIFGSPEAFAGPGSAWLVAYDGERPVACGGLRAIDGETGEIKRMFVTAGARGRGYGRALLAELERRAAAAGQRRLRLITTEALREARALYEAAGYAVVATPREGERQDYLMEKPLVG